MQAATAFDQRDGLERLLHRHPHLREDPDVAPLVFAGTQSTVDILFVVQKLLLRPDLTVAVAGCFRPLLSTLVASTVLRLQHLYERKNLVTDESSITISPFMTIQWSTAIHEYAVMAFSRILELAPYLMSTILRYFKFAPPPFERLLLANASGAVPDICKDSPPLLDVLRASYRFLHLEAKVFRDMWDWSPFLDLLLWLRPKDGVDVSSEIVCDVRWCALQVLSVVLRISDATTRDIGHRICGLSEKDTFDCLIRWEEFSQEIAVEKAGMFLDYGKDNATDKIFHRESETQKTDQQSNQLPPSDSAVKWKKGAGYNRVEICGIELPARDSFHKKRDDSPRMSFLLTPTIKKNLEALVLALSQKSPILLEGALGAGKSSLIYEVARLTGNYDVIFIHLDDETDIKMLLGNYVCTEVPGKFKWQPGALTQAVCRGLWVVFEDIDRAPSEIFSALAPLLEDRKLFIPGRGEIIHAADNFRLFSTITRMKFGSTHAESNEFNHLWKRIIVDAPNDEELVAIIESRFPMLVSLSQKLLGTFNMLKDIGSQSSIHVNTLGNLSVHIERQFSTRDLMKWCQRIAKSGLIAVGRTAQTSAYKERVYVEALDIFVGAIHSSADRQLVMRAIAEQWDIPLGRVNFYDQLLKPALQVFPSSLHIGRAILASHGAQIKAGSNSVFIHTGHAMRSMEHIAMCVEQQEPALLVGETGTGKTTLVQHLARQLAVPLVVLNLSQQSDSTELLGGYKPVEAQGTCLLLLEKFSNLFALTFPSQQNADFLSRIQHFAESRKWAQLIKAFQMAVTKVAKLSESSTLNIVISPSEDIADGRRKRKRAIDKRLLDKWKKFSLDVSNAERQVEAANTSFAFSFVEGALVKALRDGHWILLDEVNLAPRETLERLSGVLEGEHGTISLTERGDINTISRSPNFRIFACMNPATDVGKRDLPMALRNRFTEFYIDEMINREDLSLFVNGYLEQLLPSPPVEGIVNFYLQAREEANTRLLDGAGQKPHYSLRSLSRALEYTKIAMPVYGFNRALYDGVCMSFLTLLDLESAPIVEQLIAVIIFKKNAASVRDWKLLSKAPPEPGPTYILVEQFWLERGVEKPFDSSLSPHNPYILTASVKQNLKNLARAVFVRRYPVLLQGPTSSGKTSLIEYLADRTGHRFVRINNHEHTDLQEYLGTYMTDLSGRLVFQDGILVEAVRKGYWIVLDELNLAPPDVLEALNRLLDDNRELFIPEIQQTIKPHPHFMLFATQNPPGLYGGRKVLSRAFRNRFMELHVDDIPENELSAILEKRCQIPPSHAAKMVDVMKDLQRHRQGSKVFAGKHGFITPRDLFRWAERHKKTGISYEDLAMSGYMLLAERLRDPLEKNVVQKTLEKHMHVELDITKLYDKFAGDLRLESLQKCLESPEAVLQFGKIVWTKSMKRLFYLVNKCYEHREPTLLVGETGCGKTTVFQLLAFALGQRLRILNCHQNTETSDFLGGYRPVRDKESILLQYHDAVKNIAATKLFCGTFQGELPSKIEEHTTLLRILKQVREEIECRQHAVIEPNTTDAAEIWSIEEKLKELHKDWQSLFVWHDGSLVEAMQEGDLFLVDEISLAEDSVLERLNSVLEPKRSLVLAEKGGPTLEEIIGHFNFHLMATMNPGGDFGKKELSPALRNRFTEIWVPSIDDMDDIKSIVTNRLMGPHLECVVEPLLQFWQWFQQFQESGRLLSLRDLLSWVSYINIAEKDIGRNAAYIHGAFLVLLDGMTFGTGLSASGGQKRKNECVQQLLQALPVVEEVDNKGAIWSEDGNYCPPQIQLDSSLGRFGIHPFYIDKGSQPYQVGCFELAVPTTSRNAIRILRAMQLRKPVLLEGSPGVGKTSLVAALGALSGHSVVRINLSEQTDVMDLFGSDLPVEGGSGGEFRWSDGIFLQALKTGCWVLLDELNLASQSVLEGLNSCLDHRGEVYIPELGRSFKCPQSFRVFACQNPLQEGGGRKGLPKSFVNRFTKVYMEHLSQADYLFIARTLHPSIPESLLCNMIEFNHRLYEDTMVKRAYGLLGSPWEFNLRDILRWSSLIEGMKDTLSPLLTLDDMAAYFVDVIYLQRLRTKEDWRCAMDLFQQMFNRHCNIDNSPSVSINPFEVHVGLASLKRVTEHETSSRISDQLQLIPGLARHLESVMHCVEKGWMCSLVGPPKSGKTTLIRVLANLTGNKLCELSLSNATDTTELLGCFEQQDTLRCWQEILTDTRNSSEYICSFCLSMNGMEMQKTHRMALVKDVLGAWSVFEEHTGSRKADFFVSGSSKGDKITELQTLDAVTVEFLFQIHKKLDELVNVCRIAEVSAHLKPRTLAEKLINLMEREKTQGSVGRFEWVDGPLLRALKRGEWVILDNANLCSPAVLDRLNPLVEPGGTIVINECGLVDGKAMVVQAHPRFRLFLIVDSRLGEVSRAMRNRGVEIYMLDSEYAMTDATSQLSIDMSMTYQDAKKLVILSGIPGPSLVTSICNVHAMMRSYKESILGNPFVTHRELVQWIRLLYMLLERGANMTWSLHYSWQESYADAFDHVESKLAAEKMFHSSFVYNNKALSEFVPGGWPNPLILSEYCKQSMETMVRRDGSYVEFVLMNSLSFQIYMDIIPLAQSENRSAEVHQLLERNKLWAPYFPESLFRFFLDPRVNTFDQLDKSPISQGYFKDIEKVIPHAVFWMMEQTCFSDLNLCLHWLCILSTKLASRFPILDRMITVIKKEIQHPVAMQIHTALEDLKYSKILQILVPQQFLTSNSAVENKVVLWFGKLGALRRTLLQWQTEDEVLNSANGNGYSTEATLIQRSYWHYHEGSDQSRTLMIDRVVIWLYPLLVSLRQVENEVLASDIALWNSDVEKVYAEVHNAHEPFWQSLQISCVDTALLRFWWDTTKNSVRRLVELPELKSSMSKAYQGLIHLGRMVDEALGVQKVSKPLLWKYGGHPWIPHSRELYEQVKHLANLCNSYWGKKQFEKDVDEINPACADKEIRLLTLEGASMIIWLDQEACKSRRSESVDGIGLSPDMVNQETASVFQMLLKKMESEDHKCPKFLGYQVVPGLENGKKVHREFEQTSFDQFPKKSLCSTAMRSFWLDLLPLLDHISVYLDAALLARLLPITAQWLFADKSGEMLAHEVPRIGHVVEYSLKCASRSPLDFVPHQHLLWMLSSKALTMPVRSITHEILFNWHAALWDKTRIVRDKIPQSFSTMAGAAQLFQASKARLLCNAMDTNVPLKDYYGKLTQLRVALAQGWDHAKHIEDVFKDDLARASGVIQQIIFAHHNSFAAKDFQMINVNFNNMHKDIVEGGGDRVARQHLQEVELLLGHSTHTDFIKSLKTWILPCIHLLYGTAWTAINYYDMLSKRGELWVLIGQLRLQLLISGAEVDPNAKYLLRYAHLSDRLVDVELEIKVCRESMLLVRGSANMGCLKKLLQTQNDLHKSRDALRVKLVPRPDAPQFQKLREEICFFWGSLASPDRVNGLVNLLHAQLQKNFDLEYVIKEANTWQENADSFIGVLAEQFSDFRDLVQPIQLGVYEIKFGLSLLLASRLGLETFGDNGGSYKADRYAGILCHLMQYPRNPYLDADKDSGSFEDKMEQKLCFGLPFSEQLLKGASSDTFLSPAIVQLSDDVEKREFIEVELQVAVLRVSLLHMIQQFRFTRVLDKNTMMVLQTMFRRLVELWKKTRSWQLDQELEITESLKLRNSTCTMSRETELEEESFKAMFPNYWNGGEQDKDSLHVINEDAVLSEEDEQRSKTRNWSEPLVLSVQDCLLKDVISTHKQIFMCYSPFVKRNMALVGDDEQMTQAFALSYDTGRTLCTALGHVLPATVDDEVASGHLMKLGTLIHYLSSADSMKNPPSSFNIYKDSNPSEIANMLEPLASLLQRVTNLLIEWPEHPVLMQIAQTIKLLSSISLQSPVMKAVTGLEMILAKAQLWEENASKLYSISAELDELSRWVIRWRKQELASWPTLLDGIYHAHEISADKLWFSLYDLLHQHAEADLKGEIETVIESMEEFMLCSPLGEFRRRLDHVLAFYGQFSYMSFLNCSLFRISLERIRSILFNVYHYYSHFLPILQESLSTSRTAVDTEMKSFIQLYKWEDRSYSSLASSAEKAHRKVIKVMRKYDQLLKRPISEILDQHMSSSSEFQGVQDLDLRQHASIPESRKSLKTLETGDVDVAQTRVEISKKELAERWNKYSMTEMVDLSKSLPLFSTDVIRTFLQNDSVKLSEKISECLGVHIFSDIGCHVWQEGAIILEDLGTAVIVRSAELQNEKNRMVKKKAFIDLLKRLKQIGLSHHKSVIPKDQRAPRSWFLQAPSEYDCWMHIFGDSLSKHYVGLQDLEVCLVESEDVIWKRASAYYFNNLELLGHLEKKSLMYNKDLNLQEVEVSKRYAEHLLYLQQQQREKVYNFSKKLGALMTITTHSRYFVGRDKMDVTFPPQVFVRKWLWKQKILLESLCQVSSETVLFFKTCEGLGTESRNYKTLCSTISSALQSGKGLLDDILVPGNTFHSPENLESSWPIVISEQMVRIIKRNFQMLREMHTTVSKSAAANDQSHKKGVPGLDPLIKLIQKGMKLADKFEEERKKSLKARQGVTHVQQEPIQFLKSYDNVITEILLAIQNVSKINEIQKASHETVEPLDFDEHSEGNFQTWETTLEKFMSALRLDTVYTAALAAVSSAAKISDDSEISEDMRNMLGRQIGCMHVLLEILQVAGLRVLFDYMYMHRAVAKLAYILLNLFISLYSKGFCRAQEEDEPLQESKLENAGGTGMGEGEGMKDVSEDIEQEEQLVGTEKDKATTSEKSHDKLEKGIEMDEDFTGDMFDISEDESSQDTDSENADDEKIESKMGDVDEKDEIVDERFWNSGEDKDVSPPGQEKYEKDAPVSGKDSEDVELRGKENHDEDTTVERDAMDRRGHHDAKKTEREEDNDVEEEDESPNLNEKDAYEEGSGLKPDTEDISETLSLDAAESDGSERGEDEGMNEGSLEGDDAREMDSDENVEVSEAMETTNLSDLEAEGGTEQSHEACNESPNEDEKRTDETAVTAFDKEGEKVEDTQRSDMHKPHENVETMGPRPLEKQLDAMKLDSTNTMPNRISEAQIPDSSEALGAPLESKLDSFHANMSNSESQHLDLPEASRTAAALAVAPDLNTKKSHHKTSTPFQDIPQEPHSLDRLEANPLRNLGDFLKKWKERIRVVEEDTHETNGVEQENGDKVEETGMEYEYVSKEVDSNLQAIGSATEDQTQQSTDLQKEKTTQELDNEVEPIPLDINDGAEELQTIPQSPVKGQAQVYPAKRILGDKGSIDTDMQDSLDEEFNETGRKEVGPSDDFHGDENITESFISIRVQNLEHVKRGETLSRMSQPDKDVQVLRRELETNFMDGINSLESAHLLWQKYEHLTSRLSQELTEQLRLILEPTLATKLQGDYRSGKRINMKKVIPYVASDFRKDKIWLRRTKPSKRQYQVVLAIDDSRSMSESHCGHMALEALITICRAMSQLEIGQMAVASFGEKGNVHLLHAFDQPFTSDAGVQMISQFSFKQDNTIADEPMVDLLHFLTRMLDDASRNATRPSGQNVLQQLVLIIADGRFHEKESLRRVIHEAITRRQLLAFIILDNPRESLLDMQSVSFSGGAPAFSKYLDAFPFPYYILLKDIQALPRTLANLLRQWFELMQQTS